MSLDLYAHRYDSGFEEFIQPECVLISNRQSHLDSYFVQVAWASVNFRGNVSSISGYQRYTGVFTKVTFLLTNSVHQNMSQTANHRNSFSLYQIFFSLFLFELRTKSSHWFLETVSHNIEIGTSSLDYTFQKFIIRYVKWRD